MLARGVDPLYLVWINPDEVNPLAEFGERLKIVGRTHPDDDAWSKQCLWDGADGADRFFAHWLPFYESRRYVWLWLFPNEPQPMQDLQFVRALAAFAVRWAELMHQHGFAVGGLQTSVGWPYIGAATEPRGSDVPVLAKAYDAMDAWTFHEYGWPHMANDAGFNCLRFREIVRQLLARGVPEKPCAVTECGLDGLLAGPNPAGWRTLVGWPEYEQQLEWYDGQCQKGPRPALFESVFTAGAEGTWKTYEVEQEEASRIVAASYPRPQPAPPAVPPPTWYEDVVDDFPPVGEPYPERPMTGITQTVIHHSYGRQNWNERRHLGVIYRHHTGALGWSGGIGYHLCVGRSGRIYLTQRLATKSNHVFQQNGKSVGVCLLLNGVDEEPSEAMVASTIRACRELGHPVYYHKWLSSTGCPGDTRRAAFRRIKRELGMKRPGR